MITLNTVRNKNDKDIVVETTFKPSACGISNSVKMINTNNFTTLGNRTWNVLALFTCEITDISTVPFLVLRQFFHDNGTIVVPVINILKN